ncbi:uncharacterized protein CTRU02_209247 [Colletotrichum truncatum]|uniref:Uncharacterized protein n=1 Tax=Colletotrichum truncatum TaxID=5467 RepID=A0ACC3YYP9_COLTU|nr:uncharacterized protein CTRU02_14574 [Colletotrichum truncatum]KAF6782018.1 hypothetical protein CTRU02_14574 [Colletotrichum truncatum]
MTGNRFDPFHHHHVTEWVFEPDHDNSHPECRLGTSCSINREGTCPVMAIFSTYQECGLWDASDPKHRACISGQPCTVTDNKLCARILFLAKHQHAYGACQAWSDPDHTNCPPITSEEKWRLFPPCLSCGVLTEARGLILIHRRMLDEWSCDEKFILADRHYVQTGLIGYMRAYETRRAMHVHELRDGSEASYQLEKKYIAGVEGQALGVAERATKRKTRWCKILEKFAKIVRRLSLGM